LTQDKNGQNEFIIFVIKEIEEVVGLMQLLNQYKIDIELRVKGI